MTWKRFERGVLCAALALSPVQALAYGRQAPPELPAALAPSATIDAEELRGHAAFLASDALEGRSTGSPGSGLAARYLARELSALGFEGCGDGGGFLQDIEVFRCFSESEPEVELMDLGGTVRAMTYGIEFRPRIRGPVNAVFEIVRATGPEDMPAEARGDAALYIESTRSSERQRWMKAAGYPNGEGWGLLVLPLRGETARASSRAQAETWQQSIEPSARPSEIHVAGKAREMFERARVTRISADFHYKQERAAAHNVIGVLPGRSGGEHAGEAVVISAHYDHMGQRRAPDGRLIPDAPPAEPGSSDEDAVEDRIYNGADDNASGVSMVLEIAESIALAGAPERTLVVLFGTGEERGLFGSKYYLDRPCRPLDKTVLDLNFEMVGRPDELSGGSGRLWITGWERTNLGAAYESAGLAVSRDLRPEENFFRRSDNISFAMRGVVAQSLSSYNMHADYHKVSDEVQALDFDHMAAAAQVGLAAVQLVTDAKLDPVWLPGGRP